MRSSACAAAFSLRVIPGSCGGVATIKQVPKPDFARDFIGNGEP